MKENSYHEALYSLKDLENRGFNVGIKKINTFDKYLISAEIGKGTKTILSTYALHGDELPACYSFIESAKNIAEKYEYCLDNITFKALFCNPWAARNESRRTIDHYKGTNDIIDKVDLNRIWFQGSTNTEIVTSLKQEVDKLINKGVYLHIDHHAYSRFMPSTISILKNNKFDNKFLQDINYFVNKLDQRLIPKWKILLHGHYLGFKKTPLEKVLTMDLGYCTLNEYMAHKGINSILFESSGKKLKEKKLNKGIKQHIKIDSFMINSVINQKV